jgi:hypothetical protein
MTGPKPSVRQCAAAWNRLLPTRTRTWVEAKPITRALVRVDVSKTQTIGKTPIRSSSRSICSFFLTDGPDKVAGIVGPSRKGTHTHWRGQVVVYSRAAAQRFEKTFNAYVTETGLISLN